VETGERVHDIADPEGFGARSKRPRRSDGGFSEDLRPARN
jgi:hypothetical protein